MAKRITYGYITASLLTLFSVTISTFNENELFQRFNITVKMQDGWGWLAEANKYGVLSNPKDMSRVPAFDKPFPLFEAYPLLKETLPRISLGDLPTPVQKLDKLEKLIGISNLYIKRDDLTGALNDDEEHDYGGNKERKLEFLLAEALAHGAKSVMPFGCVGSNLVMATSVYAHKLGLKCIAMLKPEAIAHDVRQNLLMHQLYKTEMHYYPSNSIRQVGALMTWLDHKHSFGDYPYLIQTGGSSPVGALGFVNAAFELKKQIENGELPKPDYIYVACGSMGTAVGLALGLKAAGLDVTIVAVTTEPENPDDTKNGMRDLFKATNELLHKHGESFPIFEYPDEKIIINTDFCGTDYAVFTQEGIVGRALMRDIEGIRLDGTYTAKAFAALLDDVKNKKIKDEAVLFWNTFCGLDYEDKLDMVDYHKSPQFVHDYFENDVQPLDLD